VGAVLSDYKKGFRGEAGNLLELSWEMTPLSWGVISLSKISDL